MAANRYGKITHDRGGDNVIRFPSSEARDNFKKEFDTYHASHEHDGEAPTFEFLTAKEVKSPMSGGRVADLADVTIDGYTAGEIYGYHTREYPNSYTHYRPPTTCVAPIIVLDRFADEPFIDSGTLERHRLSGLFGDMPEDDFEKLVKSIEANGFLDPIIRTLDGQILDGWHRYFAGTRLNLLRKLRFIEWDEEKEGNPRDFVIARNVDRRHLTSGQRAAAVVEANEWLEKGDVDSQRDGVSNDTPQPKSTAELAKASNTSTATVNRAKAVSRLGRSAEVISGEKTAGEIITEETIKELWEQINPAISEWKAAREGVGYASKGMFIHATLRWQGLPSDTETNVKVLTELLNLLTTKDTNILEELIRKQLDGKSLWDDTEEQLEALREKIDKAMVRYKEKYEYDNAELIRSASLSMFIDAYRRKEESDATGEATVDELEELLRLLKSRSFPLAFHLKKLFAKDETPLYDESITPTPVEDNPYSKPGRYEDKVLINNIIPEFCGHISGNYDSHIRENAIEMLQLIGEELVRRGYKVDGMLLNIDEIEPDMDGCRAEIRQHIANGNVLARATTDYRELGAKYNISKDDVKKLIDEERKRANENSKSEREARKALKDKKYVLKLMWDNRQQASRTWMGDGDTDLNQYTDLDELRNAFPKHNAFCKDAFLSAVKRTNFNSLDVVIKRALEADVSQDDLEKENRAMSTFAGDIHLWKRADWSPATNWILPMIEAKKAAEKAKPVLTPESPVEDPEPAEEACSEPLSTDLLETDRLYDLNQRRAICSLVAPLIDSLGDDDDMPVLDPNSRNIMTADIHDLFISYENPPTDKQAVMILLDVIDSILSEPIE